MRWKGKEEAAYVFEHSYVLEHACTFVQGVCTCSTHMFVLHMIRPEIVALSHAGNRGAEESKLNPWRAHADLRII
eukprot:364971-Chlamydomonas_euryale.AAC.1